MPAIFKEQFYSNVGQTASTSARGFRPESMSDLSEVIASDRAATFIARGAGLSSGDVAVNPSAGVIQTDRLNRMLGFDPVEAVLHAEAGVTFQEILNTFLPRGFLPAVMPMTAGASLGGAVATDAFGINQHLDGSMGEQIVALSVMGANGLPVTCSREIEPDLFRATLGGLGLTGVVTDVKLRMTRVPSAYVDADLQFTHDLDDLLDLFESNYIHRRYAIGWLEIGSVAGRPNPGVLAWGEPAPLDRLSDSAREQPLHWPEFGSRPKAVKATRARASNRIESIQQHWGRPGQRVVSAPSFLAARDGGFGAESFFGNTGFHRFEAALPFAAGRDAVRKILDRLSTIQKSLPPIMIKPLGLPSPAMLGLALPGWYLSVDLPVYTGCDRELDRLQEIVMESGGRRSLASDRVTSLEPLTTMYPQWLEFRGVCDHLNARQRFASAFSRRAESL